MIGNFSRDAKYERKKHFYIFLMRSMASTLLS